MAYVPHGTTIVFGTSSYTCQVLSLSIGERTRNEIDVSHFGSVGGREFIPGNLVDYGSVEVTALDDQDTQPPISAAAETITITFPIKAGGSTAATVAGSGFLTQDSKDLSGGDEGPATVSFTIRWADQPTYTAGT